MMIKRFIVLVLVLLGGLAQAESITINWNNATTDVLGGLIPAVGDGALISTTVEYSACIDGQLSEPRIQSIVTFPETSLVVDIGLFVDWCFSAFHTNMVGLSSEDSNILVESLDGTIPPSPPTELRVTDLAVFAVRQRTDRFVLQLVGSVPIDTLCDPEQTVNGFFVVPTSLVQWSLSPTARKPTVVVASCS